MPTTGRGERTTKPSELGVVEGDEVIWATLKSLDPGLLMHNPASRPGREGKKPRLCSHDVALDDPCEECLDASAYHDSGGNLCIPSVAIMGAMINGSVQYKIGPRKATGIVSGGVRIRPFDVPLTVIGGPFQTAVGEKPYRIDMRYVAINRQRVIGYRPWIPEWTAKCAIIYDPSLGLTSAILRNILAEAGRRIGILDFRPQHRGAFGTFVISDWQEDGDNQ